MAAASASLARPTELTDEEFRTGLDTARTAYGTGEMESADGTVAGSLWEAQRRARTREHVGWKRRWLLLLLLDVLSTLRIRRQKG